jgi:hypothetical protein
MRLKNNGRIRPLAMVRYKSFKNKSEQCYYCLKSISELKEQGIRMTVDHVIPKCKGGTNTWDNLVAACEKCNSMKSESQEWYAGCVASEAFGNPEWYRDILLGEEVIRKLESGKKKNGKQRMVRNSEEAEGEWWKQCMDWNGPF